MLHCHIEWHVEAGLMATLIEAPETFSNSLKAPPKDHYDVCAAYPEPSKGNAAGKHGLDLGGANTVVGVGNHGYVVALHARNCCVNQSQCYVPAAGPQARPG